MYCAHMFLSSSPQSQIGHLSSALTARISDSIIFIILNSKIYFIAGLDLSFLYFGKIPISISTQNHSLKLQLPASYVLFQL